MDIRSFVSGMPKIELHCHLSGSVTAEDLAYLGAHFPVAGTVTDPDELRRRLTVTEDCACLQDFLDKFALVVTYLSCPEALEWAAAAVVEHAARQNMLYQEIRFSPRLLAGSSMQPESVIEAVLSGLRRGEREQGVPTNAILVLGRAFPPEENEALVRMARPYLGRGLVGVDVAGPEGRFPPQVQAGPVALARSMGFHVTVHAGEEGPPENIETAVFQMGAERIGHGTFLGRVPGLAGRLARRGTGVEMCPTSNYLTKAIAGWAEYQIRACFDAGVRLCVCSDDPAMSLSPLSREYALVMERFRFTPADMEKMLLYAADMAFTDQKAALRAGINAFFHPVGGETRNHETPAR